MGHIFGGLGEESKLRIESRKTENRVGRLVCPYYRIMILSNYLLKELFV
jgi:hypothetical protein